MLRIVIIDNSNALSKFESEISGYKRVTVLRILCFVNKTQVLLLYTNVLD